MARWILIVLFVATCAWPILTTAFGGDESQQLEFLAGVAPRPGLGLTPLSLWVFFEGTRDDQLALSDAVHEGREAWCAYTDWPLPKMKFFRPLASASIALDFLLFRFDPLGYHLHSLLWCVALLWVVGALYERVLHDGASGPWWRPSLALGALFLFAFDSTHTEVIGRVATRHLLLATVFGVLGLLLHVVACEKRSSTTRWLSLGCFALGLLSSENVLQVVPYVLCFELFRTSEPLRTRLGSLLPLALLTGGYLAYYVMSGYGASGIGYVDPFHALPSLLSGELPLRFIDLTLEELFGLAGWLGWFSPPWRLTGLDWPPLARSIAAVTALLVVGWAARIAWKDALPPRRDALRWLAVGSPLALIPVLVGQPGPRLLFIPSIGVAAVLAAILSHVWRHRGVAWIFLALTILVTHVVLAPVGMLLQLRTLSRDTRVMHERWLLPPTDVASIESIPVVDAPGVTDVVVLAVPSSTVPRSFYPELETIVVGDERIRPTKTRHWWYLANNMADFDHEWIRTGSRQFQLRLGRPKLAVPRIQTLWIDCEGYPGRVIETRIMRITVLGTNAQRAITQINVELDRDLDDPSLLFAVWHRGALRSLAVPRVGQGVVLDQR